MLDVIFLSDCYTQYRYYFFSLQDSFRLYYLHETLQELGCYLLNFLKIYFLLEIKYVNRYGVNFQPSATESEINIFISNQDNRFSRLKMTSSDPKVDEKVVEIKAENPQLKINFIRNHCSNLFTSTYFQLNHRLGIEFERSLSNIKFVFIEYNFQNNLKCNPKNVKYNNSSKLSIECGCSCKPFLLRPETVQAHY